MRVGPSKKGSPLPRSYHQFDPENFNLMYHLLAAVEVIFGSRAKQVTLMYHGMFIQNIAGAVLWAFKFFIFKTFIAILKKLKFKN